MTTRYAGPGGLDPGLLMLAWSEQGFTLVELMIVVVVLGILAAIVLPNLSLMGNRAKEGSTKANMHTLQLEVEDYGVQNEGYFPAVMDGSHVADRLPSNFKNPFSGLTGDGNAWENRDTFAAPATPTPGIASYSDSSSAQYNIKGHGAGAPIGLVLTSGS